MKGSNFIFDYLSEMHYICNKINHSHGRSYIDSPKLIKDKEATINPRNDNDDNCFST